MIIHHAHVKFIPETHGCFNIQKAINIGNMGLKRRQSRKHQDSVPPTRHNYRDRCIHFGTLESIEGLNVPGENLEVNCG